MRRIVFAATVSAVALTAGASLAQTPQLAVGDEVRGALNSSDQVRNSDGDSYRYEDYSVTARRGQRLEAVLRSDDFDAYLQVYSPGQTGANEGILAEDDDGLGEGTDSRLRFVAPENGTYILRARTLSGTEGGDFTLSLNQRPDAPRAPRPTGIHVGAEVKGSITNRDAEDDDGDRRYDAYSFRASANQRFAISLDSDAFDPEVSVGQMVDQSFVELASNDDGSDGLGSYLVFTAPRSGDYVIRAMPLSEGEGAYTLKLEAGPPPLSATPIEIGGSVDGELNERDGVNDNGARTDAYSFTVSDGQRIEAKASSDDFDTYLELFDASGQSVAQDDDGAGEGTNSRLSKTLSAGRYTIHVRGLGDGTGDYSFSLEEGAPAPQAVPLAFATEVRGEIKAEGGRDDEGRVYDAYSFSGQAGTRVQVVMRSGDFDTYLQLFRADSSDSLTSDDDGLGEGTDSRLNFILPETGEYVIRASPLGSSGEGLYSIELTDRGPQPEPGSILVGATARGTLSDNDGLAENGAYFDGYRVKVSAGDKLIVTMVSNDFDAFIDIGRDGDGSWDSIISDDDGLADTHAKAEWTVEDAGTYVIRARSYAQGSTGSYALTVATRP